MKTLLLSMVIVCSTFLSATSQNIAGTYTNKWESTSGEFVAYTLTLNPDGSFTFNSHQKFLGQEDVRRTTAEGTWKFENYLLVLATDNSEETDNALIANLNNCKARYAKVSTRKVNTTGEKPSLKFYQSDVFYAKGMELYKQKSTVTTLD